MTDTPFPAVTHITLRCPKCHGEMAMYERSGIVIDQCRECRGIFLDRGEIERLLDAEARALAATMAPAPMASAAPVHQATVPHAPAPTPVPADPGRGYDPRWPAPDPYGMDPWQGRGSRDWDDDDDDDDDDRRYRGGRDRDDRRPRRRSFLGDLLEGLGD
jgi:Zn-finger nucleic acid-binding protein